MKCYRMSQNPYGSPNPGGMGMGSPGMPPTNPRMMMPMGYQDNMGYQGRPMGPGGPAMGGRVMGPGLGGRPVGPGQYPGRMISPGTSPGHVAATMNRMPAVSSAGMDTGAPPGAGVGAGGGGAGAGAGAESMMTMTDGPGPAGGQETQPAPGPPPGKVTPTPGQSKEVNTSTVCRIGQETVEEIVSRTQEVFSILKSLKPPVGGYNKMAAMEDQNNLEKQNRLNEVLKGIGMLFKRLRVCWEKCQENTSGLDFYPIESLIPVKEETQSDGRLELEKKRGDTYRTALDEHNELVTQIVHKNRHLKDIIDQMRNIIWEINTMLAMRTN